MPAELPTGARALIEATNFATISTLREDGTILTAPVWVHLDGDAIVLNSAEGRAWPANLRRTGQISLSVQNLENPYEYVSVTGSLDHEDKAEADAVIDSLAKKYMGVDEYPLRQPGEERITFFITPDRVKYQGAE